ncbi:MAG: hypothetical protein B1H02_00950 [Candidatus Latescibacteria bacterium 4484_107]|nr:MAG: hypothetical protein B1H02_00950 [Candidatus Latescibacteria bacterium 4484_107]
MGSKKHRHIATGKGSLFHGIPKTSKKFSCPFPLIVIYLDACVLVSEKSAARTTISHLCFPGDL